MGDPRDFLLRTAEKDVHALAAHLQCSPHDPSGNRGFRVFLGDQQKGLANNLLLCPASWENTGNSFDSGLRDAQIVGEKARRVNDLQAKFPTPQNRELIRLYQGFK
jgi:hypothetical protein